MEHVMEAVLKFNNQTAGRDRLFRLFQYGSRLVWWICEKSNKYYDDKDVVSKLKSLEYTLSTGRKLLRMGRSLESFYGALKSLHLNDLTLRLTLTMAKIYNALYMLMDHVVWFGRVGLLDIDKQKWGNRANKFWLLNLVMLLMRDVYEICNLIQLEGSRHSPSRTSTFECHPLRPFILRNESPYAHLRECISATMLAPVVTWSLDHKDVALDTLKNGCDVFLPLSGLGLIDVSPGFVGACGVISSLIGILTIVDSTCRMQPS